MAIGHYHEGEQKRHMREGGGIMHGYGDTLVLP